MTCPDCGGTSYRCLRCGCEFDDQRLEDRIVDVLHYTRALSGYAITARVGYSKSEVYRRLKRMVEAGEVIKQPKHGGYTRPLIVTQAAEHPRPVEAHPEAA